MCEQRDRFNTDGKGIWRWVYRWGKGPAEEGEMKSIKICYIGI